MDNIPCDQSMQQRKEDLKSLIVESATTGASTQLLQNMNEDCLLEIFSVESLGLMDLCSIAETCKRFWSIAQRLVGKKLELVAFDWKYQFKSEKVNYLSYEAPAQNDIERLFKKFGSCLSVVKIGGTKGRQERFLFDLVKKHCDEKLKHLSISNLRISAALTAKLKSVFKRLTFSLSDLLIEGDKSIFSQLDSLVELTRIRVRNGSPILENTFPQLERFTYLSVNFKKYRDGPYLETVQAFITRHTALKSLDISLRCDENWCRNILQAVGNSSMNLNTIVTWWAFEPIHRLQISLEPLQTLKLLKTVELFGVSLDDFAIFASMTELRELTLNFCRLPEDVHQFACLSQLIQFSLRECDLSGAYGVSDIIHQLVNLVQLKLFDRLKIDGREFVLDAATFAKIVSIVKGRPNVLNLTCRYNATVKRGLNQNVELFRLNSENEVL